jgi:UDP-glucose 4-epimerase
MNSVRTLVIGGGGFIGSHLVAALLERGARVRVLERARKDRLLSVPEHPHLEWLEGDLGNTHDVRGALAGADVVYHLASTAEPQSSNDNPAFDIQSNLCGAICLLEQMRKAPKVTLVFASSGGTVYGLPMQTPIVETHPTEPQCSYGIVKLAIEKYLALFSMLYGIDYRVLRLANPYGPGQEVNRTQGVIGVFLSRVLQGQTLEVWGDGTVVRDYIYIGDVIAALLKAAAYRGATNVFNVGSGRGHNLLEIIELIERVTGKAATVRFGSRRECDVMVSVLGIQRAKEELGWEPTTTLEAGLEATLRVLRESRSTGARIGLG